MTKTIQEIEAETYLGDGLYAHFDGFTVWLRAPRLDGDHMVGLDPDVLKSFDDYLVRLKKDIAEYNWAAGASVRAGDV